MYLLIVSKPVVKCYIHGTRQWTYWLWRNICFWHICFN